MNLTFQVCTLGEGDYHLNCGEATENPATAVRNIWEAASLIEDGPLYMTGIISNGSYSQTVYVNPDWKLEDEPVDWRKHLK